MPYRVKEIFYTLQGEGERAGRPAVFCRFSGCNLWSGQAGDAGLCPFCDTDFLGTDGPGGGVFDSVEALAAAILEKFPAFSHPAYRPYVVFTGGEPALQLDAVLLGLLRARGCEAAVETNGTLPLPPGLDWVTVSPKAGTRLAVTTGDELKLVWPQAGIVPQEYEGLSFTHFRLQPRAGSEGATDEAVALCRERPLWKLSLQTHKLIGIP